MSNVRKKVAGEKAITKDRAMNSGTNPDREMTDEHVIDEVEAYQSSANFALQAIELWQRFLDENIAEADSSMETSAEQNFSVDVGSAIVYLLKPDEVDFLGFLHYLQASKPTVDTAASLARISAALNLFYSRTFQTDMLDQAIEVTGNLLAHYRAPDTSEWGLWQGILGNGLRVRFWLSESEPDLDKAIEAFTKAADAATQVSLLRANWHNDLGMLRLVKFLKCRQEIHLNAAVEAFRQSSVALPSNSIGQVQVLCNLVVALRSRYVIAGSRSDLDEAVTILKEAIALTHKKSVDWTRLHYHLAFALKDRYEKYQESEDLDSFIEAFQEVALGFQKGTSLWIDVMTNRGNALVWRFQERLNVTDINASISVFEEISSAVREGSSAWGESQLQRGIALVARFRVSKDEIDLQAALIAFQKAIASEFAKFTSSLETQEALFSNLINLIRLCHDLGKNDAAETVRVTMIQIVNELEAYGELLTWYFVSLIVQLEKRDSSQAENLTWDIVSYFASLIEYLSHNSLPLKGCAIGIVSFVRDLHKGIEVSHSEWVPIFVKSLLDRFESITVLNAAASVLIGVGIELTKMGEELAYNILEVSVRLARLSGDYRVVVTALNNLGIYYNDTLNDPDKGLALNHEAIDIAQAHNCTNETHAIYCVGNILLNQGKGGEAEPYLRRAIALGKERGEFEAVVGAHRALARQYKNRGLLPDAEDLYIEAATVAEREDLDYALVWTLDELGGLLSLKGEYQRALSVSQLAFELATTKGYKVKVKALERDLNTLRKAIAGDLMIFQMIQGSKWVRDELPIIPPVIPLIELAKQIKSFTIVWSLSQADLSRKRVAELYAQLQPQLDQAEHEQDLVKAFNLWNSLNHEIHALIGIQLGWFSDDLFHSLERNTAALRVLAEQAQDPVMQATSAYWKAKVLMVNRTLIEHGLPGKDVHPEEELEAIWTGLRVPINDSNASVAEGLLALGAQLPKSLALELLHRL